MGGEEGQERVSGLESEKCHRQWACWQTASLAGRFIATIVSESDSLIGKETFRAT